MNERIRELSFEAQRYALNNTTGLDLANLHELWHEKFAELIVGECAKVAAQTPCPYEDKFAKQTYGHTWDMACVESARNIRKHFGVK